MKQMIQPKSQQSISQNNRNKIIIAVTISIILTALIVGLGVYCFTNKSIEKKSDLANLSNNQVTSPMQEAKATGQGVYFGKGLDGKYSLVNLSTGQTKEFIPSGYTIVNQHGYQDFPLFLILQRNDDLYSYSLENKIANSIFSSATDLKLKGNEQVRVYPSITEKDKFFIIITSHDLSIISEFDGSSPVIGTRSYFFDALINKLTRVADVRFDRCAEYDSKNQRFFTWPCGEGSGNSTPISVNDLAGFEQSQIITQEEFGLSKDDIGSVAAGYQNGSFFALNKNDISKIVVFDPQLANPVKEVYTLTEEVKSQITKSYPYSFSIDHMTKTIIIGGDDFILLLRFDANSQITQSHYIPDQEIYANFIFINDGKLFYQAGDNIRVVNLESWRIEKSIPSPRSEEITLFPEP